MSKDSGEHLKSDDAWAARPEGGLFAISDGATTSILQREWADILVKGFVASPPPDPAQGDVDAWFSHWLEACRQEWGRKAESVAHRLTWLTREKLAGGAAATFLGVRLLPEDGRWFALAVGDTNVLKFDVQGRQQALGPITDAAGFTSSPQLLRSVAHAGADPPLLRFVGDYNPDDTFVLATDAVAKWLVLQLDDGTRLFETLATATSSAELRRLVETIRADPRVPEDDLTMVVFTPSDIARPPEGGVPPGDGGGSRPPPPPNTDLGPPESRDGAGPEGSAAGVAPVPPRGMNPGPNAPLTRVRRRIPELRLPRMPRPALIAVVSVASLGAGVVLGSHLDDRRSPDPGAAAISPSLAPAASPMRGALPEARHDSEPVSAGPPPDTSQALERPGSWARIKRRFGGLWGSEDREGATAEPTRAPAAPATAD